MKILLDECVTKKLKPFLSAHDVFTVNESGWNGLKNGMLMTKCVENGFEILLTIDKNLLHQQNIDKYELTIVVLNAEDSTVDTLIKFIPALEQQINSFEKRKAYIITND